MVRNTTIGLIFFLFFIPFLSIAQTQSPIKWTTDVKQTGDNTFALITIATMDDGWHVYSAYHGEGSDGIGIPTAFTWEENADFKTIGKLKEDGKLKDVFNELIEVREQYFAKKVTFTQDVEVSKATMVKGEITFQVCNDQGCLPPDYKSISFDLTPTVATPKEEPKEVEKETPLASDNGKTPPIPEPEKETPKAEDTVEEVPNSEEVISKSITEENALTAPALSSEENDSSNTKNANDHQERIAKSDDVESPESIKKGLWEIFIFGFLGGFAALLMPCIFPMIPLTVSLFTKQSKTKGKGITKALIYGISIIAIYVGLGLLITAIFGAGALNALATNPWLNIAFFILFIVFAISFFGAFEITLPSKWVNSADKGADKGGMIGIFFMALTLVLVSFSCTGPIIGTLLVESANSGALLGPAMGMFGFALALALPFTIFAIFPSWLNSLPSSGGWLNTVKVCLGFIELAFALKFLSNADLVWQAHWLEREVFLAIWIGIFFVMGMYLLNTFRMSHDSEYKSIGWPRLLFSILTFTFVFYMLPGLWGAPLKLLSGLTPPKNYSESPTGFFGTAIQSNNVTLPENAHYGPHQIPSFYDLDEAFAYAEKVNKPVMIDFTGDACANCRKVEDNVWSDPRVKEKLVNDVVLASLYVDRMVKLPKDQQVYSEEKGRDLRTIGDKWSAFQIKEFQSNSQPLYIMVDKNMNRYNTPMGAKLDVDEYLKWMDEGITNFKKKKK